MKGRNTLVIAALALLIFTSGYAKAVRYNIRFATPDGTAQETVIKLMTGAGWTKDASEKMHPDDPYPWLIFNTKDCAHDIMISFMTSGVELQNIVELYHNGDVAYIQNGRLVEMPNSHSKYWKSVKSAVGLGSSAGPAGELPLLAVSPAPRSGNQECRLPLSMAK